MAKQNNAKETVEEILKRKKGRIKHAPLDAGSPSWDDILHLTWDEIEKRAGQNKPGFRTFRKLLTQQRYNK